MKASDTDETTHADTLREMMISKLREMGAIRSDRIADAFRAVPRHLFAPGAPLEAVYAATGSVVTSGTSTASQSARSPRRSSRLSCWSRPTSDPA
jgi:Protein-L-isoaspartate(D-aspartate) O-methyltransferase (PCMT)